MSSIITISGKYFDPTAPEPKLIDINDIAHALSFLCRANGHEKCFYSVAQHSIACAREAIAQELPRDIILGCLLHDASEAYLSDVTRPIKKDLPYYLEVEDILQSLIWEHFLGRSLTDEERNIIFGIDDLLLSMEFHVNLACDLNEDYLKLRTEPSFEFRDFAEVRKEFLELFNQYA